MALQNSWNSSIPVTSDKGGTGYTTYSKGDHLIGTSAGSLQTLAIGTDGFALVADSSQTLGVKWASVAVTPTTFSANTGSATPTNNSLSVVGTAPISISGSGNTLTAALSTVPVSLGGTGVSTMDNGILIGQNGSPIRSLKVGQANVVGGNATGDAQSKTLSSNNNTLAFSFTDSNIDIGLSSTTYSKLAPWFQSYQVSGNLGDTVNGSSYYITATSTVTMPLDYDTSVPNPGMKIVGTGSANWKLNVPNGWSVRFGTVSTKTDGTGYIASTQPNDCIELSYIPGSPKNWCVTSSQGNLNVN